MYSSDVTFNDIKFLYFYVQHSHALDVEPNYLIVHDYHANQTSNFSKIDLLNMKIAPYYFNNKTIFITINVCENVKCHIKLGWQVPDNIIDLLIEFKNLTNGKRVNHGITLFSALSYYGYSELSLLTSNIRSNIACNSIMRGIVKLYEAMNTYFNIPLAANRGRYLRAAAIIEQNGIPIDTAKLSLLNNKWSEIINIIEDKIYSATKTPDKTHLLTKLKQTNLSKIPIGADDRSRCSLAPFKSRTSRNQPSSSEFIFSHSPWIRSLIKPKYGHALAYLDWEQQEFGIAAGLSKDPNMIKAYISCDPYLEFAKHVGAAPIHATKQTHHDIREKFKVCALGVLYGMEEYTLAAKLSISLLEARELLIAHKTNFRQFWIWSDSALEFAYLNKELFSTYGWHINITSESNECFIRNFLMQSNGAEMLRIASYLAIENNIKVCALIHDAILIESQIDTIEQNLSKMHSIMKTASRIVLDGFELRTDSMLIKHPEVYIDPRGTEINELIDNALLEIGG